MFARGWPRCGSIFLLSLVLVIIAQFASAATHYDYQLPSARTALLQTKIRQPEEQLNRRALLQSASTYPSNSAPAGSVTGSGLLIYTPANCSYLDADDFGEFFSDAYNNNSIRGIYLSAGNYTVDTDFDYKAWVLYMGCLGNTGRKTRFELNMEGSNLFVGDRDKGAFGFDTCANVWMHGPTITYSADQLPFTQGTLTNISQSNWTMLVDPGFPGDELLLNQRGHLCIFYEPSGLLKQNGTDFYTGVWSSLGNNYYTFETGYDYPTATVGLRVACRGDTQAQHVWFCSSCNNFRLTNTAVYSSNIFGIFESQCRNSTYDQVLVIPDPRGVNGVPPLISSNADGIHSSLPYSGPQITNSVFWSPGDDAVAVQGIYLIVASIITTGSQSIVIGSWGCDNPSCLSIFVGDSLLMYSPNNLNLGTATVKSITTTANPGTMTGPSPNAPNFNYDTAYYFRLTFTTTLPALWRQSGGPDGLVTVPNHNGLGSNVLNNTLGNNRARGIYHKGLNGAVSKNRLYSPSAVGILATPDFSFLESDFLSNMVITDNYVNCTGTGIFVSSLNSSTLLAIPQGNHKNVTISGNTVESSIHPMIIGSAKTLRVTNNTFNNGGCYPFLYGDILLYQGTTPNALVYVSQTSSSSFSSNTFAYSWPGCQQYANYSVPYQLGPGLVSVTFA